MRTIELSATEIYKGYLILINRQHAYREPAAGLRLSAVNAQGVLLESKAAALLKQLLQTIGAGGQILIDSGLRSLSEQQRIYAETLAQEGPEFTARYVALPGHSEHQSGLACDLAWNNPPIDPIRPEFPSHGICGVFRRQAANFGFVERYPEAKQQVTGIGYEPWHFRYVGYPHSWLMVEQGLALEEYLDWLRGVCADGQTYRLQAQGGSYELSYRPARQDGATALEVPEGRPWQVSGDNRQGFILTVWGA